MERLLKVSADGLKTEILASGFRAINGLWVEEDGTFFATDQEGHWTPKNRINWVRHQDVFTETCTLIHIPRAVTIRKWSSL